jgi:hypothetical protein
MAAISVGITIPSFAIMLWTSGIHSAIAAWVACSVVTLFIGARMLVSALDGSYVPLARAVVRPVLAAIVMSASVSAAYSALAVGDQWATKAIILLGLVLFGALTYAAAVAVLWILVGRPRSAESELLFVMKARLRRA